MTDFRFVIRTALSLAIAAATPWAHADEAAVAAKLNLSSLPAQQTIDRFIVSYRPGSAALVSAGASSQIAGAAMARAHLAGAAPSVRQVRKLAIGANLLQTSRRLTPAEAAAWMRQLASDPAVEHVEPDVMLRAVTDVRAPATMRPASIPSDPSYASQQWHFNHPVGGIGLPAALDLADGSGVVVAVLDTGITEHPDLDTSLAASGYDFTSSAVVSGRDEDGRIAGGWDPGDWTNDPFHEFVCGQSEPSSWHGTHVAGTIAELTDNGIGLAGVAGQAKVLPVRVLGHCGGSLSDIADGVVWAAGGHVDGVPDNAHPAQVINMSLGGPGTCSATDVMGQAINTAVARGSVVVVAAGNDGKDAANFSPASCPGVLAVAATGITGKRAYYSNYGSQVGLAAPGGGVYVNDASSGTLADPEGFVWSTYNDGEQAPGAPTYTGYAGTSQATPHVSGTLALMLSALHKAGLATPSPSTLRNLLIASARTFPQKPDHVLGAGILDAPLAIGAALAQAIPLFNGRILAAQNGEQGDAPMYYIEVPAGALNLTLRTTGGSGDTDIYVKQGSMPALDGADADARSTRPGTGDVVVITRPVAGKYYLRLVGKKAFANVTMLGAYSTP